MVVHCLDRHVSMGQVPRAGVDDLGAAGKEWSYQIVSWTFGGICGVCFTYPLDTIKVRLQARPGEYGHPATSRNVLKTSLEKEGTMRGIVQLTRGMLSPLIGYGALTTSIFTTKELISARLLRGEVRRHTVLEEAAIGSGAGFTSSFIRAPMERVKTVMQVREPKHSNSIACAFALYRKGGLAHGLYAGYLATVAREVPQYCVYFMCYDRVKRFMDRNGVNRGVSPFIAGGIAGSVGWLPPVYSIDVIKSRLQAERKGVYDGILDCAHKSYQAEGSQVFFRGLGVTLLRSAPLHGLVFLGYENAMSILRRRKLHGTNHVLEPEPIAANKDSSKPLPGKPFPISYHMLAGTLGGIFGLCVVFPLDTIKCRMQTRLAEYGGRSGLSIMRQMAAEEGFFALYRGLSAPAVGWGAINASIFFTREATTTLMKQGEDRKLSLPEEVAVGINVGFWHSFVRAPVERVKTIMQVRNEQKTLAPYKNSALCAADLIRKQGVIRGLFTGIDSVIAREIPQFLFYFSAYDGARPIVDRHMDPSLSPLIAGGIAGCVSWLPPTYCIDVVKSRMQSAPEGMYSGILDCARKTYNADGYMVFFRGLSFALTRGFLMHGCVFLGYETTKGFLLKYV